MSNPAADRNLLFGVVALQMDFITRDALIAGMNAWILAKEKPLGQVLVEQAGLAEGTRAVVEALVAKHLELHGNDPARSLASLDTADGRLRGDLSGISDADVQASLVHVASSGDDPYPTLASPVPSPSPQASRPRFHVLRPHARGGLGEVFVAEDTELHREVALKQIQFRHAHDANSRSRFIREAEITGQLEHPAIVPVYGFGTLACGRPYYAMRFIKGDSLQGVIDQFHSPASPGGDPGARTVAFRALLDQFIDACNAVAYAHSRNVIHRDIKPANIMVGKYGETLVVDWGLAKTLEDKGTDPPAEAPLHHTPEASTLETVAGAALGTPQYMSPEQAAGRLDLLGPASDVYSLGATFYCLLTGHAPFSGSDVGELLQRVQQGDFPPPRRCKPGGLCPYRKVPPALAAIALKAMALRPEDRYSSALALSNDLEAWLADEPVTAYPEPLPRRLLRWGRRHPTLVATSAALLITLVIGAAIVQRERERTRQVEDGRVHAEVDALLHAEPPAVPRMLSFVNANRDRALPLLVERRGDPDLSSRVHVRAALALLATDPSQVEFLRGRMFEEPEPAEVILIRDALRPHEQGVCAALWAELDVPRSDSQHCLRALVALAAYDPGNPRWNTTADKAIAGLLEDNPRHLDAWARALHPVRRVLLPALARVAREGKSTDDRYTAARLLADYAADQPPLMTDLVLDANREQFEALWPKLKECQTTVRRRLSQELDRPLPADLFADGSDQQAQRQAQAAVALLKLGEGTRTWSLLQRSPDPRVRTYLTYRFRPLGIAPDLLWRRWTEEEDPGVRAALLLALGEYPVDQFSQGQLQSMAAQLGDVYGTAPDPGLHAAINWLLSVRWNMRPRVLRLDADLAGQPPGARRWYVDKQGNTLTIFPGPVQFTQGSPAREPHRLADEGEREVRIPRAFAVATRPVTVEQFQAFLQANSQVRYHADAANRPVVTAPVAGVSWLQAVMYCRWLSEQEAVPEEQMCYPPLPQIKDGMKLPKDYLERTGYRLPTEAEWEYACRGGARTCRFYGNADELLPRYAWFHANTRYRTHPVGQVRPNDFGLFDVQGNVWEWCQDRYGEYLAGTRERPFEDREDPAPVSDRDNRVLRGGLCTAAAPAVRSAARHYLRPTEGARTTGLRVARTWR